MYKINSWIGKSFKSDKNNITFHTTECIYFIRERDAWLGKIIQNTVIRILIRMKVWYLFFNNLLNVLKSSFPLMYSANKLQYISIDFQNLVGIFIILCTSFSIPYPNLYNPLSYLLKGFFICFFHTQTVSLTVWFSLWLTPLKIVELATLLVLQDNNKT